MGFFDAFTNRTETREKHKLKELRTRYYKIMKPQAIRVLSDLLDADQRIELLDVSEERGEIIAQIKKPRRAFMVASVITVHPYRTAIDFTITTETMILPIDFGYSKKQVLQLYQKLDRQMEFAGTGVGG